MSIYEVVVIVFLVFALIVRDKATISKSLYGIAVLGLLFIAAMKGLDVGTDTFHYYIKFCFANTVDSQKGELVHDFIRSLFRQYFNYDLYMLFIYSVIIGGICYVIYRLSNNRFLSLFLYVTLSFYTQSLNIMRQYMAVSLMLVAIYLLYKQQNKKGYLIFALFLFTSFFIHHTSLLALLFIPLLLFKIKDLWWYIALGVTFVIGIIFSSYLSIVFEPLYAFLEEDYTYYLQYIGNAAIGKSRNLISNAGLNLIAVSSLYFVSKKTDKMWIIYFLVFSVILNNIFGWGLLTRISIYFAIAQVIAIPLVISSIKNDIVKAGYWLFIVLFAFARFYVVTLHSDGIMPYMLR